MNIFSNYFLFKKSLIPVDPEITQNYKVQMGIAAAFGIGIVFLILVFLFLANNL